MRCYRVYANGELVGTFFNITLALSHQESFLYAGYDATVEIENYEY